MCSRALQLGHKVLLHTLAIARLGTRLQPVNKTPRYMTFGTGAEIRVRSARYLQIAAPPVWWTMKEVG